MVFEVGKFYKHTGGEVMHIVSEADTFMYENCLIAESSNSNNLLPICRDEASTINWIEIREYEYKRIIDTYEKQSYSLKLIERGDNNVIT